MDIAILGPGALGGLLAAGFRLAGADVRLVDHRPERVELLRGRGLEVTFTDGAVRQVFVPVALPAEAAPCSLVIIAVKAYHTARAAQVLPPLMAPGGLVLTLQNGLGNLEILAQAVGPEPLLAGVSYLGATRPEDGRVIFAGRGPTYLGAPVGSRATAADLAAIAQLFQRAGFPCEVRLDIETLLWEKLLVNVGINPLTALLRVPNGALPEIPEAWDLARAAATEANEVALAAGIHLPHEAETYLRRTCTATAANRSSMLQDVLAGRATEIEALNAQVSSRGRALNLPTPVNDLLTQLMRALGKSTARRVG